MLLNATGCLIGGLFELVELVELVELW